MKIKSLVRVSHEFQVVESEAEIEVKNDCDMQEAFEQLQQELITASMSGLQKTLGQVRALKKSQQQNSLKEML